MKTCIQTAKLAALALAILLGHAVRDLPSGSDGSDHAALPVASQPASFAG